MDPESQAVKHYCDRHICGIFRDQAKQSQAVTEFLLAGIKQKEKGLAAGPANWLTQIATLLERSLPDLRERLAKREIELLPSQEVFLGGGNFSAERMLEKLEKLYQNVLAEGFKGVRAAGEMSWAMKSVDAWEQLFTYEAKINQFVSERNFKAYCVFDPAQIPAKQLYRALLTHPGLESETFSGASPIFVESSEFMREQWKTRFDSASLNRTGKHFIVLEQKAPESEKVTSLADQMLDNIRDSVVLVDAKGEILFMNRAGQNRYGNQVNRICHQSIFPQHDPCPICEVVKLVKQGKEKVEMEIQDQEGNYLSLSAYPFLDGTGNGRFIVYIRDITQRRKWEQESAFLDKFASLGYLSSGIAHELNNNLTPILICAQMLGQANLPEGVKEKAQKIETCATNSKRLVESLTDFAQQIPHHKAFTNLNSTLQRTLDLMEYRLSSANIKVKLNLDQDLPSILVDELKIQQVFSNLITNAYQALQNKGGEITVTTNHSEGWCKFEIKDSGPGIPLDIRSKIFDPFFTTRQFGEGKGLGLSTSFGIVSAHQGKLYFRTQEGEGTTFVLELPVAGPSDAPFFPLAPQGSAVPAESLF